MIKLLIVILEQINLTAHLFLYHNLSLETRVNAGANTSEKQIMESDIRH